MLRSFIGVREWKNAALQPQHIKRASLTCVVVGAILVVITQAVNVSSGEFPASMIWQIPLTFLVPFFVSLFTSAAADRSYKSRGSNAVSNSDDQLRKLNEFPDQNPNPVLRITSDGVVEYANPASALVCEAIGAGVGEKVPAQFFERISKIANSGSSDTIEVASEGRSFALLIIGVFEYSFINIYGTEITDALALEESHRDNEILLLNILPAAIADRLKSGEGLIADRFDEITVPFADVVDFTRMASRMGPEEVVKLLNDIFTMFDELADEFSLEKIKTIGDAYMVVGGLGAHSEAHAQRTAEMGMNMLRVLREHSENTGVHVNVRIGMHSGPVVAGVVGIKKFIYDVWGETVNTASRMESHGVPGRIQVVDSTRAKLEDDYEFEEREIVDVKGIGKVQTHLLIGRR